MGYHNSAAPVEPDFIGHTRFAVPVLDNDTLVPPAKDCALDTSPHGESQDLLGARERSARIFQIPGPGRIPKIRTETPRGPRRDARPEAAANSQVPHPARRQLLGPRGRLPVLRLFGRF